MSAEFRYRAINPEGGAQHGVIAAASLREALRNLNGRGLDVIELEPAGEGVQAATPATRTWRRRVGTADLVVLMREMATLLKAWVSMAEVAPSLVTAYAGTSLGEPLGRLRQAVQQGQGVGAAMRACGLSFPDYVLALVEAGEMAGRLGEAMEGAANALEYDLTVRREFRNALIYPSILVGVGLLSVITVFMVVVPRFAPLLKSGRAEIPVFSRAVIEAGLYFQAHWLTIGLGLGGLALGLAVALASPVLRDRLLAALSGLPLVGQWLREGDIGRWANLLSTLLTHRVPLLDALELSARALTLAPLRLLVASARAEVRRGRPLSEVLAEQGWITPARLNLVRVGERAGDLPAMLGVLGGMHTDSARARMRRLLALIEPVAILVIGAAIGLIMIAILLAITSLNTARL